MRSSLPDSVRQRGFGRCFWYLQAPDQRRADYWRHVSISGYVSYTFGLILPDCFTTLLYDSISHVRLKL